MRHHFFVFRWRDPSDLDMRCPTGGLVVCGWTLSGTLKAAWEKADTRYPCKEGETLLLVEVHDKPDKLHAEAMDRDWERAFADFHKLMTVS